MEFVGEEMKGEYLDPKRRASEFDPSLLPQVASSKFFKDDPSKFTYFKNFHKHFHLI